MADNGVTMEQVFELIAKMNENQQANLMAFATELNKGTPEQQKKREEERQREIRSAKERAMLAQSEEKSKELRKRGCQHATTHPGTGVTKHSFRAQVHAPAGEKPYFIPTCQQCWWQGPKILATPDMLTNGVNLDQYTGLTLEVVERWANTSHAA